jgi:RimJ/RimL family protein N-acetyltransferase
MSPPWPELPLLVTERTPAPAGLAALTLLEKIAALRELRLRGACVVFTPYDRFHGESLRQLRNLPHNQQNLAQAGELTPVQQSNWEEAYFARINDLSWILLTRAGEFAGSVSLYDIDAASGETGRLVLREDLARTTPILAECELMVQWLAFGWLGLQAVKARVQPSNVKMVAMHQRLGYRITGPASIRGVPYLALEISPADFKPEPHARILEHWCRRHPSPR